jgi:transcriptional regulator with XRE-family HTH domain
MPLIISFRSTSTSFPPLSTPPFMFTRRSVLSSWSYWLTEIRMDLMRAVNEYMATHKMNRRELAEHLDCTPSYVSQLLNGDTNVSLEKLCKVSLAINKVPRLVLEDLEHVIEQDELKTGNDYELAGTISGSMFITAPKPVRQVHLVQANS